MPYKNPDLKKSLTPTLDQLKKYVEKAINDDPKTRDVRPLMSYLQRLAHVDRKFLGLMQTRKFALLGFPYTINFPSDVPAPDAEKKKLEEIKNRFRAAQIHKLSNTIYNGIIFGMSATQLQWANDPRYGTLVINKKSYPLTDLDFSFDNDLLLDILTTDNNNRLISRNPIDPDTHIFMRYNPIEGIDNDYPGSYARSNMIHIWLKYSDFFNWSKANEKFGDPLTVAMYDKDRTSTDELAAIDAGLVSLGGAGKARFSKDIELKFIEAMRSGITDMHEKFIKAVDDETAVSLVGQSTTSANDSGGSYAKALAGRQVSEDILWADIQLLDDCFSEQYVKRDYLLNYGEPRDAYPVYQTLIDEKEDYESNARTFSELKLNNPNLSFKKDEVYKRTGWTIPGEEDETL